MEIKIVDGIQEFKPVTLSITFDTPEEVRAWMALLNEPTVLEGIITEGARRSPDYFKNADTTIVSKLISWKTVWEPLNKLVNKR